MNADAGIRRSASSARGTSAGRLMLVDLVGKT